MPRYLRILLVVGAMVVLVVGVALGLVQAALFTPLPRALVEDELGELFGRRVRLDAIAAGWGRQSQLTELRVLSHDHRHVALHARSIDADHPWLVLMVLDTDRAVRSFIARDVEVGRHITWLRLATVEAHRSDTGDALIMEVTGEANGLVTISGLDEDDTARIQMDLRTPDGAADPPFAMLSLDAWLVDNMVVAVNVRVEQLDLGPLMLAVSPSVGQVYGRLTGRAELTLPDGAMARADGRGEAAITDSDFVDIPLFAAVYDTLRLRSSATQRTGRGSLTFRLAEGVLLIDEMDYTNRGAYIEIAGRIADPFKGGDAAVDAYAIASLKPLPDEPVLKIINNLLTVLQQQVTSIRVTGTLAQQKLKPEPLKNIGDRIGELLRVSASSLPTVSSPSTETAP